MTTKHQKVNDLVSLPDFTAYSVDLVAWNHSEYTGLPKA